MNKRKLLPWVPILGIFPTIFYHAKYGDTGLEDIGIMLLSGIFQGIWLVLLISILS